MPTEPYEWGSVLTKFVTADVSSTSTSLADVTDLVFPVDANVAYNFDLILGYKTAATATAIGLAFSCPASPTWISYRIDISLGTDGTASMFYTGWGNSSDDLVQATNITLTSTTPVYLVRAFGILSNGANAGNLALRFKSETAGTAVTIMKGSGGQIYPVP